MEEDKRHCPACGARVALSAKECLMCGASLARLEHRRRISIPIFVPATFLAIIILTGLAALLVFVFQHNPESASVVPTSTATVTPTATATSTATATPTATPTATSTSTPTASYTPTPTPTSTPTSTPTPTSTSTPTPSPTNTPMPTPIIYTVKRGDTLSAIAAMYGITVEAIAEANGLSVSTILRIGQQLIIPSPGPTGAILPEMVTISEGGEITYIVQPGDSLYFIATLFGTTVEALMMANGITDPELIRVGQELVMPSGTPTPTMTFTPAPTPTPMPTPEPTYTPTTIPTFTPSTTPQPTPQSTPQPSPSPTLAFPYPAPALLAPADGQVFRGVDEVIIELACTGRPVSPHWG
jgi:LysM repeat protein